VAQAHDAEQPAACRDTTPHKVQFITVAPNVSVEVVDWGGDGEAMLLLTGLGDNAHVFDGFAFQFTDRFHVIGITRRGYLPSSQPKDGYDIATRVADDIAVLDALAIRRAIWVGHSISGSELSAAGLLYKDRVDKLVYLDAYDLSQRSQVPGPPDSSSVYTDADVQSIMVYQAAIALRSGAPASRRNLLRYRV
jgi:pimeloyl-ACP methyl ester carboxylesterase